MKTSVQISTILCPIEKGFRSLLEKFFLRVLDKGYSIKIERIGRKALLERFLTWKLT